MSESMHCANHPNVETYLRCNKCGKPICARCAVRTPVGYRCRECVSIQQQVFYADFRPIYYVIPGAVALVLGTAAGFLIPSLGWYTIFLGPVIGGGIAEIARWSIRRRRGRYTWLVVCGSLIVGALPRLALSLLDLLGWVLSDAGGYAWLGIRDLLWSVVYLVTAVGAAYAMLRPGRRR